MGEFLLIISILLLLGGSVALLLLPAVALFSVSIICLGVGLGLGVPAGIVYHVRLYRHLRAAGPIPSMLWLFPTRLHEQIEARARTRVLAPFRWGAAGFVLVLLGCLLLVAAMIKLQ